MCTLVWPTKSSAVKISCTIARTTGNVRDAPRSAHPFPLNVGVRDGGQDDVMLPPGVAAPFEMIQPEFALEFLILLFDRPPLMRQRDEGPQRRGGGQMNEAGDEPLGGASFLFAEQPDFGTARRDASRPRG